MNENLGVKRFIPFTKSTPTTESSTKATSPRHMIRSVSPRTNWSARMEMLVSQTLKSNFVGAIAVAAYSYMALVPMIQPFAIKLVTTKKHGKGDCDSQQQGN